MLREAAFEPVAYDHSNTKSGTTPMAWQTNQTRYMLLIKDKNMHY